jgi:hypothetical protein
MINIPVYGDTFISLFDKTKLPDVCVDVPVSSIGVQGYKNIRALVNCTFNEIMTTPVTEYNMIIISDEYNQYGGMDCEKAEKYLKFCQNHFIAK